MHPDRKGHLSFKENADIIASLQSPRPTPKVAIISGEKYSLTMRRGKQSFFELRLLMLYFIMLRAKVNCDRRIG
jgi:hypothetical protein